MTSGIVLAAFIGAIWNVAPAAADNAMAVQKIRIGYIQWGKPRETLSFPENPTADRGVAGARLAIADNNTTGKFTKQQYELVEQKVETVADGVKAYERLVADGVTLVVADLPAEGILKLADDNPSGKTLIFNISAKEDSLREENCRADVVHVVPSYTMLADGLAQYLIWKRWPRWFLLTGALPNDKIWADAIKRAASRFGAEIVEERIYSDTDTSARTDSGQAQVQKQMPVFTQNAPDHDVVMVADVNEIFAAYVPYRTWDAKPVAGSSGLMPTEWSPTHEQWGGFQTQNRFYDLNHRWMRDVDADAWTAVRMIGEAATRTKSADADAIRTYITSPKMEIAAYKGQKLTLRAWNQQLRQPILLTDGRTIVSVSPQEGFLHERSELDTMGIDEPETACKLK